MANLIVDIDNETKKYISDGKKNLTIYELFNTFGVDLHFLLKEKKYSKNFNEDIKSGNYIISDSF